MKKSVVLSLLFIFVSINIVATTATSGFTGIIDFPSAFNLRKNNFTISGSLNNIIDETKLGIMFQGGFIPQVETGIKLSTKDTVVDEKLLKANFKLQFVQEGDNPAIAIGFVEDDEITGELSSKAYGYLVASKSIGNKNLNLIPTLGVTYNDFEETNCFFGLEIPLFRKIKLLGEVYSYDEYDNVDLENDEKGDNEKKISYNLGGEFYTTKNLRTKLYWRERNESLGLTITYLGIYE